MPVQRAWTPGRGDIVWVDMAAPHAGAEGEGRTVARRPALVLSPAAFSAKTGIAVVCPVVDQVKGYPFEVELPDGLPVSGVVLADRVTSIDWRTCGVRLACTVPDDIVAGVQQRLLPLLAEPRGVR